MLTSAPIMRVMIIFLVCLSPLVWVQPTLAGSKSKSGLRPKKPQEDSELTAKKACAEGDFKKGVSILADLYVQSDNATHIYNQGRCYEQNHQWVSAIDRFREYLRKARNVRPDERAEAEEHIAECKRFLEEEEAKNAPPPAPPIVTPPPQPAASEELRSPSPSIAAPAPAPASSRKALRTTGIVVGSVGVAALAAAVILNVEANQLADAGDGAGQSSYKKGALASYGVGGAAVATGIVFYLLGRKTGDPGASTVAFSPTWTASGPALAVHGGF